jgi:uncharacterized protein (DUF924 family)
MTIRTLVSEQPDDSNGYFELASVLQYWSDAGRERWFVKDPQFDLDFRTRYLEHHLAAAAGRLDAWSQSASGTLALIILLDQFPRNAFRDTAHMYATDPLARSYAYTAVAKGYDEQVAAELCMFVYMPFMHSESLVDQERSVRLQGRLGNTEYAAQHYEIIRRFGRFPHRNAALCRKTTPEEQAFLDAGGFSG